MDKENLREFILKIELVPETSWYKNLRKCMKEKDWNEIRYKAYVDYGHRCGICGAEGRLECHEIWRYDDEKHVQELTGFIALCNMCHHVKHIGLARILADRGQLNYENIVEHFLRVNGCGRETFNKHRDSAFEEWEERSKHEWRVDLGEYVNIVKSVPQSPSDAVKAAVAAKMKLPVHVKPKRHLKSTRGD